MSREAGLSPRQKHWSACGFLGLLLVLMISWVATWIGASEQPDEPLATVKLPDGVRIEVLGASVNEYRVEFEHTGRLMRWLRSSGIGRFLPIPMAHSTGSATYQSDALMVERQQSGPKLLSCRAWSEAAPSALFLELRVHQPNGDPLVIPSYLTSDHMVFTDDRLSASPRFFAQLKASNSDPVRLAEAMKQVGLPLLVQHLDPEAGWIHLIGPHLLHENMKDRYLVMLPAWRRDLPTLDFRMVRQDGSATPFSIKNPDCKTSVSVPVPAAYPHEHKAMDYTLRVKGAGRVRKSGKHPFTWYEMELSCLGQPVNLYDDEGEPLRLRYQARDEWGNITFSEWAKFGPSTRAAGVHLPAAGTVHELECTVTRTSAYPRHESEGVMILKGEVDPDGKHMTLAPLPDASRFGITSVSPVSLDPHDKSTLRLNLKVRCVAGATELPALECDLGRAGNWQVLIFLNGSSTSAMVGTFISLGGNIAPHLNADLSATSFLARNALPPGTPVRIGIFRPLDPDTVRFTVAAPK